MEWLKGGKTLKRKREMAKFGIKKEMNRKRKEWRWAPKRLRSTNKKEHRYG
ncbi:hypothetical protein [Hoylesella nanceiensis]|uniref:hypothetical protein n=1 Tax=Hoylesella nanceiensis TaxID=425941 RepID=UPI002432BE3F|nr:hypothetical protein [Hoylesella nanceiensis]